MLTKRGLNIIYDIYCYIEECFEAGVKDLKYVTCITNISILYYQGGILDHEHRAS
ncbi:hypothetical protein SAMN04487895_10428 [Paenibacillus sophorae]|uniref:Uncharacterized protein n=1 Tax=Paenibacillus sophorae TaxID=1333845 RepID=A0A1H8KVH2_9BACL|nr:hypothetical protein SAMN04487895_10428 [Paenibacillus sophorae]